MNLPKLSVTLETALVGFFIFAIGALGAWLATFAAADPRLAAVVGVTSGFMAALVGSAATSYAHKVQAGQAVTFADLGIWLEQAAAQFAEKLVLAIPPQPQASITMTTTPAPDSGTSAPSVTTTATVGDVSVTPAPDAQANAARLAEASNAMPPTTVTPDPTVDAIVPTPEPPQSDVSASTGDASQGTVITPTASPQDTEAAQFVTDSAGNRFRLVPAAA